MFPCMLMALALLPSLLWRDGFKDAWFATAFLSQLREAERFARLNAPARCAHAIPRRYRNQRAANASRQREFPSRKSSRWITRALARRHKSGAALANSTAKRRSRCGVSFNQIRRGRAR